MCEGCYYGIESNKEFILVVNQLLYENTLATPNIQELLARIEKVEAENRQLKAKSSDNVFIGGTENLTLKNRQLSQRGWAVPTKNAQGQGYLRCGDFPMNYFLSQDGSKVVLHTEIPVQPHEATLFKEKFLMQNMVVAKRRTDATPQVPTSTTPSASPAPSVAPTATAAVSSGSKSWSTLDQSTKDAIMAEAKGLLEAGLFNTLPEAVTSVLHGRNISK